MFIYYGKESYHMFFSCSQRLFLSFPRWNFKESVTSLKPLCECFVERCTNISFCSQDHSYLNSVCFHRRVVQKKEWKKIILFMLMYFRETLFLSKNEGSCATKWHYMLCDLGSCICLYLISFIIFQVSISSYTVYTYSTHFFQTLWAYRRDCTEHERGRVRDKVPQQWGYTILTSIRSRASDFFI